MGRKEIEKTCDTCAFCGAEPDCDKYCSHPEILKKYPYGLTIPGNSKYLKFCIKKDKHTKWEKHTIRCA